MSPCAIEQKMIAASNEGCTGKLIATGSVEKKGTVVCPKPRRLSSFHAVADPSRARPFSPEHEDCDANAGNELLDIIFSKNGSGESYKDKIFQEKASSSPPFFSGSPPSRVSNPLIQDARFRGEKFAPVSPRALPPTPTGLEKFSKNPAIRIEGFDCLDRDNRRSCSIPALA